MRTATILAVALVLAGPGCRALGLGDEGARDFTASSTRSGEVLKLDGNQRVVVEKFDQDFSGAVPRVKVSLKNEGDPIDFFSADVEFGYPAPAGSFAPYIPEFVAIDVPDFVKGKVFAAEVSPPPAVKGRPLFARIVTITGKDVRMTTARENSIRGLRQGTLLLTGRVEVVKIEDNLEGQKPSLSYTIENVDSRNPDKEIGNLKYMVQFFKDGKQIQLGRRTGGLQAVEKPLGKAGSRITIEVAGIESVEGLAGAKPVLRLTQ